MMRASGNQAVGSKRYDEIYPDIHQKFLDVLKDYTAGDPMQEDVMWTNLTLREISPPIG